MEKPIVSSEWTAEERLNLIAYLSDEILRKDIGKLTLTLRLKKISEQLFLIATSSKEFLEINRVNIEASF